jgi:hypothetical protein
VFRQLSLMCMSIACMSVSRRIRPDRPGLGDLFRGELIALIPVQLNLIEELVTAECGAPPGAVPESAAGLPVGAVLGMTGPRPAPQATRQSGDQAIR